MAKGGFANEVTAAVTPSRRGPGTAGRPGRAVAFVGLSGSGKTTLIERLVPAFQRRGYRVAAVKHDPHGKLDLGPPHKDSARFARAGADVAAVVGPAGLAALWRERREPPLEWLLAGLPEADVMLLEGFRELAFPKVLVLPRPGQAYRAGAEERVAGPFWAWVGEEGAERHLPALPDQLGGVPRFRPGDVEPLAEYLLGRWQGSAG